MTTTRDLLAMCVNEYFAQLSRFGVYHHDMLTPYLCAMAFDYIARGDY